LTNTDFPPLPETLATERLVMTLVDSSKYPNLANLVTEVLNVWPEHERYLENSLGPREEGFLSFSEKLSDMVTRLATVDGGIRVHVDDYRFLCEEIYLPEEFHFRRHGSYRLTSFEEALSTVYNNAPFMARYMNGLLVSDVLWINHCRGLQHFADVFLNSLPANAQLLEIGPGHGLLLHLASQNPKIGSLVAYDVSQKSVDMAGKALKALGAAKPVRFELKNILDDSIMEAPKAGQFDAIVFSEVLEHLDRPEQALRALLHLCKPGGRVWINVPANSPAPDHLYLVREPKQAEDVVRNVGFEVVDTAQFPMTGVTMERALKQNLTISCIVVGRRPFA
jgi:2-polyprenyl-3-methyl-5-hydroxy-6-metoxy-1,4-benzoquinol methylase